MTSLYQNLAHYWHRLTPPEDYKDEASAIASAIYDVLPLEDEKRYSLLELGAGGGHSIYHLKNLFDCTALDIAQPMLDASLEINPNISHKLGDMRTAKLNQTFDIVIAHDAIDYMTTQEEAQAAVNIAAAHLKKNGVALIAPTYTTETFMDRSSASDEHQKTKDDILAFTSTIRYTENSKSQFYLEMDFNHKLNGKTITASDQHLCGLFPAAFWQQTLISAGLKPITTTKLIHEEDVPMFVAQKV